MNVVKVLKNAQERDPESISETRLMGVLDAMLESCCLIGFDWRYLYVNDAVARHAGMSREAMLGRTLMEVHPGVEETPLFGSLRQCMTERRPRRFESEFRYPDGTMAWFELSVQPQPDGLFVLSVEITDRKRESETARRAAQDVAKRRDAEQALRASDERFRQLAETIQEVFWLTNVDKGEMIYISPAYETIWGRTCSSLYESPRDWVDAIHPEDRDRVMAALGKQPHGTYDEEYRIIRPDGSIRWIHDRGFPVAEPSGPAKLVAGSAQDVTKRRSLEAQLQQTQKLESIGLLAGGIAHDFNNLLTVISTSCYSLKEAATCGDDCAEIIDEIRQAGERATALTRQLLAFSRREVVVPRVVELTSVMADTEKMLRRVLGEDVLLTLSLGRCSSRVNVDPGSWVQVLMNLAVNARDAMPRGGKLTIETGFVTIGEECARAHARLKPGPYVTLSVSDTGSGMPPEVQARVFEPFFTTKNPGHGTGLGLSVVHGIVAQSGGHIQVWSSPGDGTTFRMYIPAVDGSLSVAPDAEPRRAEERGTETILLVEDEEPIRRLASRALEKLGYIVLQCADGVEALARARQYRDEIHLVMTDVVMPRMDGHSLVQSLRTARPNIEVLFTSGYTDDAVVRYGIQHDEVEFLPKPYDPSGLRRRVREVLDGHGACAARAEARAASRIPSP